jgi:hypothetical protein
MRRPAPRCLAVDRSRRRRGSALPHCERRSDCCRTSVATTSAGDVAGIDLAAAGLEALTGVNPTYCLASRIARGWRKRRWNSVRVLEGTDNNLWEAVWDGSNWSGPLSLGMGPLGSPPGVAVVLCAVVDLSPLACIPRASASADLASSFVAKPPRWICRRRPVRGFVPASWAKLARMMTKYVIMAIVWHSS